MISCTEFIWTYNDLFRFIEEESGEEKVIGFWTGISENFLGNLREYIEKDGLEGMKNTGITPSVKKAGNHT